MANQQVQNEYSIVAEHPAQMWVSATWLDDRLDAEFYQPVYVRALQSIYSPGFAVKPLINLSRNSFRVWWGIKGLNEPISSTHIPYIRPNEADETGWIEYESLTTIERHWADDLSGGVVHPGDLLVEVKGNARKVHVVRNDVPPLTFVSGSMYRFAPKDDVDFHYVSAYLTSETCQTLKERLMSNSIIKWINPQDICQLPVPLPPRPVQEYIGAKVRLAERCRLRARELWHNAEQTFAEALKMPLDTSFYEQIDEAQLQSADYQLYSTKPAVAWVSSYGIDSAITPQYFHPRRTHVIMQLKSLGIEIKGLAELATRRSERVAPEKAKTLPCYVGLAEIDSATGYFDPIPAQDVDVLGTSTVFKTEDVLFSKLRPYLNKVSICPSFITKGCGSTELLVYRNKSLVPAHYLFFAVKSNIGLYQILDTTAGSTLPRVDPEIIDELLIPIVGREQQLMIDRNVKNVFLLRRWASKLVAEAKSDVEALIDGRLDIDSILAGTLRAPTWDEIDTTAA